jgi:acyl carrier protein
MTELKTRQQLEQWLVALISELLNIAPEKIDLRARFERYGIDSAAAVGITDELERALGRELEPMLLYKHRTIEALARHLSEGSE